MIQFHAIDLNEVQLQYSEVPGPGPAWVILHGLTGSQAEFLHLAPFLAWQVHLYLLDMRGHGRSGWATSGYQVPDYGRDVAAFLQQVVGQPAILHGHSLGAMVAAWLAVYQPGLIQGLFLEDPPFYLLQMERFRQTDFYRYFAGLREYLPGYHANGGRLEDMIAYVGRSPADGPQTMLDVAGADAVRERALQLHQVDPATLEPILTGDLLAGEEPDELLARIRCPVHVVAAEAARGGAVDTQDLQRIISRIPHCTHAVIERAGHDIHLMQPEALMSELRQFLRQFTARPVQAG